MQASTKIVLEKHRKNKDGLCAVKIRVTHNRKSKYYSIRHLLKDDSWNFCADEEHTKTNKDGSTEIKHELDLIREANRGKKKDIWLSYEEAERKAKDCINKLTIFSFSNFERLFLNKSNNWDYLHNAFTEQIQELKDENRLGYASSFNSTLTAIKYFMEKKDYRESKKIKQSEHANFKKYKAVKFIDVDANWLKKFEQFLKNNGKSTSTLGVHTRNLRVLFNKAIKQNGVRADYPFNDYKPKTSTGNKRALSLNHINLIASYKAPLGSPEEFARDMFIFSFLANGMNMTDIFRLKNKDISEDELSFVRYKTKHKTNEVKINVTLTRILKNIIKRHGNLAINEDVYVFRVLNNTKDEETRHRLIKQKTKQINYNLKAIAKKVSIPLELANSISTYYARHSFATTIRNSGESVEYIQESLGHSNSKTTQKYLDSFEKDHRTKTAQNLDRKIVGI
jgi:site-specific recombinase XerD